MSKITAVLLALSTIYFSLSTVASATEIRISKTKKLDPSKEYFVRDNTKEVVIDQKRGLMWQDNAAAKKIQRDWSGAKSYCRNLTFAGYSDWHLPGIRELESIAQPDRYPKAIVKSFQNVTSGYYWSSSEVQSNSDGAWSVSFKYGFSYSNLKTYKYYVRCVRAGQ